METQGQENLWRTNSNFTSLPWTTNFWSIVQGERLSGTKQYFELEYWPDIQAYLTAIDKFEVEEMPVNFSFQEFVGKVKGPGNDSKRAKTRAFQFLLAYRIVDLMYFAFGNGPVVDHWVIEKKPEEIHPSLGDTTSDWVELLQEGRGFTFGLGTQARSQASLETNGTSGVSPIQLPFDWLGGASAEAEDTKTLLSLYSAVVEASTMGRTNVIKANLSAAALFIAYVNRTGRLLLANRQQLKKKTLYGPSDDLRMLQIPTSMATAIYTAAVLTPLALFGTMNLCTNRVLSRDIARAWFRARSGKALLHLQVERLLWRAIFLSGFGKVSLREALASVWQGIEYLIPKLEMTHRALRIEIVTGQFKDELIGPQKDEEEEDLYEEFMAPLFSSATPIASSFLEYEQSHVTRINNQELSAFDIAEERLVEEMVKEESEALGQEGRGLVTVAGRKTRARKPRRVPASDDTSDMEGDLPATKRRRVARSEEAGGRRSLAGQLVTALRRCLETNQANLEDSKITVFKFDSKVQIRDFQEALNTIEAEYESLKAQNAVILFKWKGGELRIEMKET
ncbi:hypothetical protein D9756_004501 [Leucocoprinus leucothites]|uniref:Uncharacterized protein n=1 Tax=Leucocoprinus leucothites TaxID=201217 RepID=A0A8H5LKC6_9AGAR|nr:hypothetical protein D9756_004501 [Leucoagaricus leucothites]